jgi:polysaccharide biosynthesis protein PslG
MKRAAAVILTLAALGPFAGAAMANDFAGIVANDVYNGSTSYRNSSFAAQQALGVGIIRQTLDWASVEIAPNNYDFSSFDNFVVAAAQHNIRVLPVLFDPPPFRSSKPARHAAHGTYFPKNVADMGVFAALVAQRYGPDGTFWRSHLDLPDLHFTAYQIWNEPNLAAYSPPKPSASKYVAMLRATTPAIKAVDPTAEIVTAGLPDSRLSKPNLYKFIKQMYQAGAKGTFDTIGINPYAPTAGSLIKKLRKIRSIMASFGDGAAGLWVTEIGWSDVGPGSPFRAGKSGQGKRIVQSIAALKSNAASLNLRGFFYFAWRDGPVYKGGHDFWGLHTGLLRKNGSRKPAYAAFKKAVAAL